MNKKAFIAAVFILISVTLRSQDNYVVDWDYTGRSFISFILETESRFPVRFFYEDEWVNELILGSYGEKLKLNEILDSLFSGKSIYYYPSGTGNIILTRFLAIKQLFANYKCRCDCIWVATSLQVMDKSMNTQNWQLS